MTWCGTARHDLAWRGMVAYYDGGCCRPHIEQRSLVLPSIAEMARRLCYAMSCNVMSRLCTFDKMVRFFTNKSPEEGV